MQHTYATHANDPARAGRVALDPFTGRVTEFVQCVNADITAIVSWRRSCRTGRASDPVRRVTLDPSTGRVTEYYANAAYCRLAGGASVEEHLAAVAARALPEHVTQLDHLLRCCSCSK